MNVLESKQDDFDLKKEELDQAESLNEAMTLARRTMYSISELMKISQNTAVR